VTLHYKYRPDIDGLRAIAVLGVLCYHIDPAWLTGGFVGVDVFFVISGFLITSLMIRDLKAGRFSIAGFYERRIRRILPALFCMIIACCIAAWFILLPEDYMDLAESAKYAALSLPNLYFLKEIQNYFGPGVERFPLLHTWSLGVEEQFYIAFPLLLTFLFRRVGKPGTRLAIVSVLCIISFMASVLAVPRYPEKAFFLLHYRAWELMLGALIAMSNPRPRRASLNHTLGVAGLAMIVLSMVIYTENTAFPGASALLPCLGAGLVILTGGENPAITARLLAWRPLVLIGLISYSVYLWHWPLIVFARHAGTTAAAPTAMLLMAGSLVAGALSWRFIEQPFRKPVNVKRPMVFAAWALTSLLLVGFWHATRRSGGFAHRYPDDALRVLEYKKWATAYRNDAAKHFRPEEAPVYGAKNVSPDIAVWGDSHARALMPALDSLSKQNGRAIKHFGMNGVPPVIGTTPLDKEHPDKVAAYNARTLELLSHDPTINTVILISAWSPVLHTAHHGGVANAFAFYERSFTNRRELDDYFVSKVRETIERLLSADKRVVVVEPVPAAPFNVPDEFARILIKGAKPEAFVAADGFHERHRSITEVFESFSGSERFVRVSPAEKMIIQGKLLLWNDHKPLFADLTHLSEAGAFYIRDLLAVAFRPSTGKN
jgi:peptidoglycan/LPS O-acetylase OafA/YrhL